MICTENNFKPYRGFSIPSGWHISKNLVFDIDPSIINGMNKDSDEYLDLKDKYFNENLFISKVESFYHPVPTSIYVAVSIHCIIHEEDINNHHILYKSKISIIMKHKDKELEFINDHDFLNIADAVEFSNELMEKYTYVFRDLLNSSGLNIDKLYNHANDIFNS